MNCLIHACFDPLLSILISPSLLVCTLALLQKCSTAFLSRLAASKNHLAIYISERKFYPSFIIMRLIRTYFNDIDTRHRFTMGLDCHQRELEYPVNLRHHTNQAVGNSSQPIKVMPWNGKVQIFNVGIIIFVMIVV